MQFCGRNGSSRLGRFPALTEDAALLDRVAIDYAAADNGMDAQVIDSGLRLDR